RATAQTGRVSRLLAGRRISVDELLRMPSFAIVGISGAMAAVSGFLILGIYLGSTSAMTLGAAVAGFVVLAAWVVACDQAASTRGPFLRWSLSRLPFQAAVHGVALALNVGMVMGAVLASLWESALFFNAQRPQGSARTDQTAGAVPGNRTA